MTERVTLFANVVLPVPIHQEFTYRVPHEISDQVKPGLRVVVPFGKSKLLTGIITSVHDQIPKAYQARFIEHLLDEKPIITGKQYTFWEWLASYYMAPIGDVMNAALPANFKLASETKIVLHPDFDAAKFQLTDRQDQIIEALEIKETLDLKEISELIGIKTIQPIVKEMIDKKMILSLEELNYRFTPKTKLFYLLSSDMDKEETLQDHLQRLEQKKGSEKQLHALLSLLNEGNYNFGKIEPVEKKILIDQGVSASALQTLEKNGVIRSERYEIGRIESIGEGTEVFKALSDSQSKALDELHASMDKHVTTLLHGVTGSGKTEIYVQLIQEQLDLGKQVLFLLPEIALTTQLIQRLSSYFGDQIGVYHSKFSQNERVEIWNHVLNNDPNRYRIVLGARSSVFLPFQDLGLIIVDEEHESTFKQYEPSPRYNARDASIVLAHLHHAKVVLGSATPSMESYYNAKIGKYGLVELTDRFGGLAMPEILVADVKKEKRQKSMQSHFTSLLLNEMNEALGRNEQIILFQNRRGYTPLWSCEVCNWTPKCKNCDVSLTYHKQTNSLKCHYCGHVSAPMGTCAACGSNRLKMLGFGTEKIEDELQIIYPDKTIKRLDLDSTRSKHAYEHILNDFGEGRIDILIGTQMVTKGLDFDNVSLVGVLDADHLLNRVDFRAFERSYQLMSQVSGRSGRKHKRGKVVIQAGDPENWVIRRVIEHDYIGFYGSEILERKNFFYPPFYKIIQLTLKHKDEYLLDATSALFASSLKDIFKERVLGPEYPVVKRINNLYLKNITLKIERDAPDKKVKERLQELIDAFYSVPLHKSIRMVVDVDPA